jgi:hypothetical protein
LTSRGSPGVRRAVEAGTAISNLDRVEAFRHLVPLPVGPEVGPDGRLDLGSRHYLARSLFLNPKSDGSPAEVAEVLVTAAGVANSRFDRLCAAVRRDFPELH